MTRDIIIVGAGGWGRETAWILERINAAAPDPAWRILGYADDDPAKAGLSIEGYPVVGSVDRASKDHPGASIVVAVGDNAARESIYRRLRGHDFPVVADPTAVVAPTAEIRHGVFIGPMAVVAAGAEIGKFAIVNTHAGVGHDAKMGDFSQLCPGAALSGHSTIGERALMGTNSCTCPGVTVGAGAKIAAGMPVYADVPDGATVSPFGVFKAQRTLPQ